MSAVVVAYPSTPCVIESVALCVITALASTLHRLCAGSANESVAESVGENLTAGETDLILCTCGSITGSMTGSYIHNSCTCTAYLIGSTCSRRTVTVSVFYTIVTGVI